MRIPFHNLTIFTRQSHPREASGYGSATGGGLCEATLVADVTDFTIRLVRRAVTSTAEALQGERLL